MTKRSAGRPESPHDVERRVYVKTQPRRVWLALHDPAALSQLLPELTFETVDPTWPAAGAVRRGEARIGLLRTRVTIESLELRPDAAFRLAVTAAEFAIEWGWRLEPSAGGTRVVHDGRLALRDRWAGLLVRLGRESVAALAEAHLRALKEHAEGPRRGAAGPAA